MDTGKEGKDYQCATCGETFSSKRERDEHQREHQEGKHKEEKPEYQGEFVQDESKLGETETSYNRRENIREAIYRKGADQVPKSEK